MSPDLYEGTMNPTRELNDLLAGVFAEFNAMRRKDGSRILIPCRQNENPYNYFGDPNGWMFCWTVHPDTRGQYHTFDYQPKGKGSQSGKAVRWKLRNLVTFSQRNKAKARAYSRYLRHYHPEETKPKA